ncbi:MAG: DUF4296 domain-containing protein [Alistipes sp.]
MKKGLFCLLTFLLAACSHPTIVPDDELAMIFRDAFLTNAYLNNKRVNSDSLNIYEPIFAHYGYTTADVQYTIGNFSKRKSARLGDVVEEAINLLDKQGDFYDREVAILDTIDNAARHALGRVVYSDTLIRVQRLQDTARLHFDVKDIKPGQYNVSLRYIVDSLDENMSLQGGVWLERKGSPRRGNYTYMLRHNREESYQRTLIADTADHRLIFDFAGLEKPAQRPSIVIRDLKITYTPPAAIAVDSFYHQLLDVHIFAEEFFRHAMQKDSL